MNTPSIPLKQKHFFLLVARIREIAVHGSLKPGGGGSMHIHEKVDRIIIMRQKLL